MFKNYFLKSKITGIFVFTLCFGFENFAQTDYSKLFKIPDAPDYSAEKNWAALPNVKDFADLTPVAELTDNQKVAKADVFYIHPTMLTKGKPKKVWNGILADEKLNKDTRKTAIRLQSTIFNGSAKIYAPFYRQAHIKSFGYLEKDDPVKKQKAEAALALAYEDVKAAFEYYLKHFNNGRPIIIAGHSQGARHGAFLLQDFFDGKPLQQQLVAAYIVGMPIPINSFKNIPVCDSPDQIGCFVSWRTFKSGHYPKKYVYGEQIACVNPLSWKTDEVKIPNAENKGAVLRGFDKIYPELVNAQVKDGLLWCDRPKFPGSWLIRTKNYHAGDLNLYYLNIRENVALRTEAFLK